MGESVSSSDAKSLWKVIGGSAFLASMCCFPSIVLVMFGLASVSTATALSNNLYWGENGYWWFRPALTLSPFDRLRVRPIKDLMLSLSKYESGKQE